VFLGKALSGKCKAGEISNAGYISGVGSLCNRSQQRVPVAADVGTLRAAIDPAPRYVYAVSIVIILSSGVTAAGYRSRVRYRLSSIT
jgi:hypothetical protein